MTPDRKQIVNYKKIEEYYWNGRMVVYVDNQATDETFQQAVERAKQEPLNLKDQQPE